MKFSRRREASLELAAIIFIAASTALAADPEFPKGPVKFVVPFPPGGPTDTIARIAAQKLQEIWGQPAILEYKPGAGTVIGTDAVAKSAPNGHTIGVVVSTYTINPSLRRTMPFDTLKDLAGVTQLASMPIALVAHPAVPFNTVPEMIAYAKRNPGKLSFATPGPGGTAHLSGELLKGAAGIDMVHIGYKGSAPAQTDLMGGRVDLMFDPMLSAMPFVRAGKLKVIAVLSEGRIPGFAQYPTIAEHYPGLNVSAMLGFVVPSATPRSVIEKIQADTAAVLRLPDVAKRATELGLDVVASTPSAFDAFIQGEIRKWGKVIQDAGIPRE